MMALRYPQSDTPDLEYRQINKDGNIAKIAIMRILPDDRVTSCTNQ